MQESPNIHTVPMGHAEAAIASIDAVLAIVPTSRQNMDHLLAIESDAIDELAAEVAVGWITADYADDRLRALRLLTHPQPELKPL